MFVTIFAVAFSLILLLFFYYLVPFILRKVEETRLKRYCREHGILVLTYDDGPGPILTTRLLEIFKNEQVRVTFFFLGWKVAKFRNIALAAKAAGHEIGFHGQRHCNSWKVAPWTALNDIKHGYQTLSGLLPDRPVYRPPFGKLTIVTWAALKFKKNRIGWWTYVAGDTYIPFRPLDDILREVARNNGGIILMHDADRPKGPAEYEVFVVALTQRLVLLAKEQKMRIKTLGEVIEEMGNNL